MRSKEVMKKLADNYGTLDMVCRHRPSSMSRLKNLLMSEGISETSARRKIADLDTGVGCLVKEEYGSLKLNQKLLSQMFLQIQSDLNIPNHFEEEYKKQLAELERKQAMMKKDNEDEINALPITFTNELMNKLMFLKDKPKDMKPTNQIEIDGVRYSINVMEKLKTGEFVAIDTILKNDPHDYISVFAVLCRKDGEIYDSKFEAEEFNKRVELMGNQPAINMLPLIAFFFNLYIVRKTHSLLYSEVEEGLNLIQQNIDNSENLGVFKRRSLNSQMKKLRKLLKSNKSI